MAVSSGVRFQRRRASALLSLGLLVMVAVVSTSAKGAEKKSAAKAKGPKITYDDNVRTIFRDKCFACHNTEKKTAGLDLTTYSGVMTGGGSGAVIDAGNADGSYLFSLVSHSAEPHMPPKSDKLPDEMLASISKWIDGGALESRGSKAAASKKPKADLSLKSAPTGRPEGPPPMPGRLCLEPIIRAPRATAQRTLTVSPWAPLAAAAGEKQVLLYNTQTLDLVGVLPFPEGIPYVLKFSRNGQLLLAGGGHSAASGRVVVWNVKTGERLFEVGDELDAVLGADIGADQSLIALGGPGKIVRVFSTADGTKKFELKKHTDWIYSVAFSPDGVLLATADRNGGVVVWEAQTGREYLVLAGHASAVTALSWRIDSNLLASGSEDTTIKLWEMENGAMVKTWAAHGGGVTSIDFVQDGRIASCGRDGLARLWDNGAAKKTFSGFADVPLSVAYCNASHRLIAGDWTGAVRVFDADGKQIGALDANPPKLDERVDAAAKQVAQRQTQCGQLKGKFATARAEVPKRRAEFEAAKAALAAAKKTYQSAADAQKQARLGVSALDAEIQATARSVAALEAVLPLIKETAGKNGQAAAKVAGDKELAAAATQMQTLYTQKRGEVDAGKRALVEKKARRAKVRSEVAAGEKRLVELNQAIKAAEARAADPVVAAQHAVEACMQSLAKSQGDVQRWTAEVAFRDKTLAIAGVQSKLLQLAEGVQTAQTSLDGAKAEVSRLQQGVAAAEKKAQEARAAVKRAQDLPAQLAAEHAALLHRAAALEALIPGLHETLGKLEEAARHVPGDPDVLTQVSEIKSLKATKIAELASTKKGVEEKLAAIELAKGQIPVAERKLADCRAKITVAKQRVAEATVGLKPFEEKLHAAKSAQGEGSKTLEAAKKQLDALKIERST